ncbi:MAG: hypothetical protein V3T40_01615 [Nitrososphaerales archaeon]
MNRRIIIFTGSSLTAVAIFASLTFIQTEDQVDEILNMAGQNAAECIKGNFKADPYKDTVEIFMDVYQWRFSYCSISVYEGQTVMITLKSLDVPHGFAIDGYPEIGDKHISPNAETVVKFIANKVGTFTYYCTVFCGEGHALHRGQLVVQSA